ncbi:AraC family transcriptional regulator [Bacteroidales bacterium OttesenSCG-928-K03]|nr:AraC family transcriptional regulator [Bacteroidales bacterium OttesenSCG-928-L14]MDL2242530.1 AraC family transcriptional regulator [Bacteroidales bacterium OttesenSCG-928-K03]
MNTHEKNYVTFNYSDIVYSYYFSKECMCSEMVREHFLVYIYSGEYILEEGDSKKKTIVKPGESVFLRRDVKVKMYKQPKNGEPFMGIFMTFKRNFLRNLFQTIDRKNISFDTEKHKNSVIKLPQTPDITGLSQSLTPYFDTSVKPSDEIMNLKLMEGVYSLLNIDNKFFPTLFDFAEPWKIDIIDFLNENYMYELSLDEIASFTGRSLSTFKRDFKKVSELSPEKWLINKRLEVAHEKLQQNIKSITDVYTEVGFKNFSHFSSAFKKRYGVAPSNLVG